MKCGDGGGGVGGDGCGLDGRKWAGGTGGRGKEKGKGIVDEEFGQEEWQHGGRTLSSLYASMEPCLECMQAKQYTLSQCRHTSRVLGPWHERERSA